MLDFISAKITSALLGERADADRLEICTYGVEGALYTLLSTAGLLLIGLAAGLFLPTCVLVTFFYSNQSAGGGYHASTHTSCFVTMASVLLTCILVTHLRLFGSFTFFLLAMVSGIYLWFRPMHLHANKEYLLCQRERIVRRSRIVVFYSLLLVMLMYRWNLDCFQMSVLGMIVSAVSRYAAIHISNQSKNSSS